MAIVLVVHTRNIRIDVVMHVLVDQLLPTVFRHVFERLEASGFRELKVHLTEEARAHAFAAAVPAQFAASVGYGRGERSEAHSFQLRYEIVSAAGLLVEVA